MLKFKYDHEDDGVFVTGGNDRGSDVEMYISSDDIVNFFECIMVDRIKEVWENNKQVAAMMVAFSDFEKCDKCDGKGVFKNKGSDD